jgi:hypothetical protein
MLMPYRLALLSAVTLFATASSALALAVVEVPEPESITILATGIAGAVAVYAIRRWTKRK